jgi:hypothetical protein
MKYQNATITINREEDIKINDDLFATIGFSIDAEMTAEEPQTWENPGCPSEVDQWLNLTIDKNNIAFYTNFGKPVDVEWSEVENVIMETILDRAEDTSNDWIADEI